MSQSKPSSCCAALRLWCATLLLLSLPLARAAGPEQPAVSLAVGGKSLFYYLPLTVAERLGYFEQEGLQLEIVDFAGGAKALQAVMGSSAQFAAGAFEHVLHMQAKGQSLRAVALLARYPAMVLALSKPAAERFKDFADLRGMTLGVTAPGSSTHLFLKHLLSLHHLQPEDVSVLGVGSGAGAVAAIRHGGVDGLVHLDPVISQLEAAGEVVVIVDTRTAEGAKSVFGGTYHAACLYAKGEFLASHPLTVQALVNAQVRALRWIARATPGQIADLVPESYWGGDRAAYIAALEKNLGSLSPDGVLDREGAQRVLTLLSSMEPDLQASPPDLDLAIDDQFIRRVPGTTP